MSDQIEKEFPVFINQDNENFYKGYEKGLQAAYFLVMSSKSIDEAKEKLQEAVGINKKDMDGEKVK